jgi:YjbE family integral membrane protein
MRKVQTVILSWLSSILGIFLIDLVLSGDNAIVIGVTASQLPPHQRRAAILIGGGGAIVLRIVFALAATFLLQLRLIGIIGSVVLLFIAIRLLTERSAEQRSNRNESLPSVKPFSDKTKTQTEPPDTEMDRPAQKHRAHNSLSVSIITILLADVTMSLDNVLAIGGLAGGNVPTLMIGLVLSVTFLLIGSALVAALSARFPLLLDLACLIVAWTAAQIFLDDDVLHDLLQSFSWIYPATYAVALTIVLVIDILLRIRDHQHSLHQ